MVIVLKKHLKSALLSIIAVCLITASSVNPVFAEDKAVKVFIDDKQIEFDVNPIIENERTLVPMRFIFEALGANVTWDSETQTATAIKDEMTIKITIDNNIMIKNGEQVELDVPTKLIDERTLVPVRAVSEGMGANVEWDGDEYKVIITTNISSPVSEKTPSPAPTAEPSPIPSQSPQTSPTDKTFDDNKEYNYNELAKEDMEALKNSYDKIRYSFEQYSLPDSVLTNNEDLAKEINEKGDGPIRFMGSVWNHVLTTYILRAQTDSEYTYSIPENVTEKELLEGYTSIIKDSGLEADNYFETSYETLKNGNIMLMLTFKETDTPLACKYIGITVDKNNNIRYFTAETDALSPKSLFIGEIISDSDSRGVVLAISDYTKDTFLNLVNALLDA